MNCAPAAKEPVEIEVVIAGATVGVGAGATVGVGAGATVAGVGAGATVVVVGATVVVVAGATVVGEVDDFTGAGAEMHDRLEVDETAPRPKACTEKQTRESGTEESSTADFRPETFATRAVRHFRPQTLVSYTRYAVA